MRTIAFFGANEQIVNRFFVKSEVVLDEYLVKNNAEILLGRVIL